MNGQPQPSTSSNAGALTMSYLRAFIRAMSWTVGLALGLMVLLSLIEGVGVLMLIPILQLVGLDMEAGATGGVTRAVAAVFAWAGVRPTLIAVLVVYVLIVAAYATLVRGQSIVISSLQYGFVAALRQRLYRSITHTDWLFFSRRRASDFTHALTTEMDRVGAGTYHLLNIAATTVLTSVYLLLALTLSPGLTTVVVVCGALLLLVLRSRTHWSRLAGEGLSAAGKGMYAATIESLAGMKTVKSYGAEERSADLVSSLAQRMTLMYMRAVTSQADVRWISDVGSAVILCAFLYASVQVFGIPAGALLLLLLIYARIMPRVSGLADSYQNFAAMLPAYANVVDLQARCDAAVEPRPVASTPLSLGHGIRFEGVSFSYEAAGTPLAVEGLTLDIRAGQTTAIVGPSGAGKTTVADLVMGLVHPCAGQITIDGRPLDSQAIQSWRRQIGYVAQDSFLLHDTVKANLLWGNPAARLEEIQEALRLAAASEFVSSLPEGVDTTLGDRGVRLSGGERQRLALARALVRRPSLLILDEATSSLDSENERRIQDAIERLRGATTILAITHRLSTIRRADVIHVLDHGRLVQSGDWASLYADARGRFRALCAAQDIIYRGDSHE